MSAPALVTLDDAKTYLGIPESDTSRDVTLQGLLDAIAREVVRHTGRDWIKTPASDLDAEVARTVVYRVGQPFIDLAPYEARTVSSIVIDPDGDYPYTLLNTEYQMRPITKPDGVWDRIHLQDGLSFTASTAGFDQVPVEVTGRWGHAEVPEDVVDWVLELVEDRFREDVAAFADFDGNVGPGAQIGPVTIPYRIKAQLDSISRPYIGGV